MDVFVSTFGCTFNKRDSENICGVLLERGFKVVDSVGDAGIVVVNSCGVKSVTQDKVVSFINSLPGDKRVVVGGCLPRMLNIRKLCPRVEAVFDTNTILSLPEILGAPADIMSDTKEHRLDVPIKRKNKDVAIIPISQGCLGKCAYCSVKFARGSLKSYSKDEIVREVRKAVASGCNRINLTAQDAGCWGMDIGDKLPNLLRSVLAVEGDFIVRLGMANPNFIGMHLKELAEIFKSGKMLRFLHVPVQSGSDKVLKEMHRDYSVDDFRVIVKEFRKAVPDIYISTDIIVGYPSETEVDLQDTADLLRELKLGVVNISRFGPRPGTVASKMVQLSREEIKRRSMILHELVK